MTVHRDKFLVNKTNRCNEFQIYWYYDSTRFGQPFRPSWVLSLHRHWYILCSFDDRLLPVWWPFATRSRMELANQFHPAPGYKSGIQWVCWFYSQGVIICFVHLQTTGWTKIIFLESETQQSHAPTCNLHFVDFIGLCEQSFVFFNYADTRILKRHASV